MKLYRWLVLAALMAGCVWMTGCKKEADPEYANLKGRLTLTLPEYVNPGYTKTFTIDTLMKASRPDGGTLGYRFTDPYTSAMDTLVTPDGVIRKHDYTLTVTSQLATQSLTLTAIVPDKVYYYSTSAQATFTTVNPGFGLGCSLTNVDYDEDCFFVDLRDGKWYYFTEVQDRLWMIENLAWEEEGVPFKRCDAMTDVFGHYYTWEEAQTACPDGWRLPTDAEWTALVDGAKPGTDLDGLAGKVMGDIYFNGKKMWEYWPEVKITNELGLNVMPTGYASVSGEDYTFGGLNKYAAFWTSDEENGMGICRYLYQDKDIVYRGKMSKTDFAASVRCVLE